MKINKKMSTWVLSGLLVTGFFTPMNSVFATDNDQNENFSSEINLSQETEQSLMSLVPEKMSTQLSEAEVNIIAESVASGLIEATVQATNEDNVFAEEFNSGTAALEVVIPIYDLNEEITETMLVFDEGYIIMDSQTNELIEFSESAVNKTYFEDNLKVYSLGFNRFSLTEENVVAEEDVFAGMSIEEIKKTEGTEMVLEGTETVKPSTAEGTELTTTEVEVILDSQYFGSNEGTSVGDMITDPKLWLLRYYPKRETGITNLSVTTIENYSKYAPEILQSSSYYPESEDCALISTLEIINYHYGSQSQTNRTKAYNAMKNSSYFSSSNGVYHYHNDDIFKVAAQSIGKGTQSVSNDPAWKLGPSYASYKSTINTYGPSYLSINSDPYGAHTVTVKGYAKYKTTYKDRYAINRTYYNEFIRINDHWSATTGDAYLYLGRAASTAWYLQAITPG